ncbi:chemotaxis protein CheW [Pseudomonas sp. Marseille-Q8238]
MTALPEHHQPEQTLQRQQYLTFVLDGEHYAVDTLNVREIIELGALTQVPRMPPTIRGAINLRGAVVPVLDLQARFGAGATHLTRRTCIVILEVHEDGQPQVLGVLVEAVSEVLEIDASEIRPAPAFGSRIRSDFIQGMARLDERFVTLLALDRVLRLDEIGGHTANDDG